MLSHSLSSMASVQPEDAADFSEVRCAEDLRLCQPYTHVTLTVNSTSKPWTDMMGTFGWKDLPTSDGGTVGGPTFTRTFESGQVVEYGLHTPSQRMDIVLHNGMLLNPQVLRPRATRVQEQPVRAPIPEPRPLS